MAIELICRKCESTIRVRDSRAGTAVACPRCQADIDVPGKKTAAAKKHKKPSRSREPLEPWLVVAIVVLAVTVASGIGGFFATRFILKDFKEFDERVEAKKNENQPAEPVEPVVTP
ncbi:MAG: hypothetical protein HOL01_04175 [Planctomycetaceae bacterium]|jgi:hypothetical protein|nr:hypothetical protein [Planctomycetaceae bacterium]MBT6486758.1 hypothetical protein [Planctomycetaceae bacterium]MBT6493732.1 hypothetical protein [Planctomycetaceae bacterium]